MKTTAINNPIFKTPEYPYLAIYPDGDIILLTDRDTGVAVHSQSGGIAVGYFSNDWDYGHAPFTGTVTLSND